MIIVGMEVEGLNLSELREVRVGRFQVKMLLLLIPVALFISATLLTHGALSLVPMFLLGLMYAHAVELQHQCLHNTAYRSKRWNRFVGVQLGMPLLVSFSDYQSSHMNHHRLLGTPEDKEFFNYGYGSLTSLRNFIPHLFMVRHYLDVARFIMQSVTGSLTREGASPKTVRKIRTEYLLMGAFLISMLALSVGFQTFIFVKLWLIPLLVGVPAHALIELPEHFGCNGQTTDVLKNTRTIKCSKFANWYTDGNNYHVEHHWMPAVPNDKFVELHRFVEPQILHLESSYWSFYGQFLSHLIRGDRRVPWETKRQPEPAPSKVFKAAAGSAKPVESSTTGGNVRDSQK